MPLTWWLQAELHINEEDHFQQNLSLTLQAMAADKDERDFKVRISIHKEVEGEINILYDSQIDVWLRAMMTKMTVFTTGKGDILLKMLCSTTATTYSQAEIEAKKLKSQLEAGIYRTFGLCISPKFCRVACIAIQGNTIPTIDCANTGKPLVLLISTVDQPRFKEVKGDYIKDCIFHFKNLNVKDVEDDIAQFYATVYPCVSNPNSSDFDPNVVPDLDMLDLFE
ncbi:ORF7 [unidentified adenovirus]|uniref:ORF7 n=1 Tax=Chinstrap penguin adenovirus 2 TaxID=1434088 RepID=A0A161CBA0_9ADEN|nr:ORF7 [Chinstrap penguin adenovirus 2]ALB78156.1 ORF7 [Chinstrap penguin adenovirus 2]ALB78178.1 ORF7 [unidentified adenovirus]